MYRCRIDKHIWRNVEQTEFGANAYHSVELPFVPFVGLRYCHDGLSFEIRSIEWHPSENKFICNAKDGSISGVGYDHFTFEELLEEYKGKGWDVRGVVKLGEFAE